MSVPFSFPVLMLAMKDSAVGPAGLFDLRRQKRLLDGLDRRLREGAERRQALLREHAARAAEEAASRERRLAECKVHCVHRRREALDEWDAAEEGVIGRYESEMIRLRRESTEQIAKVRQQAAAEAKAIEGEAERRRRMVRQRYEKQRHQPEAGRRAAVARLTAAWQPMNEALERSRQITLGRLDHLPQFAPLETPWETLDLAKPASLEEAVAAIERLAQEVERTVEEMRSGWATRIIDQYYLPVGVALFALGWAALAYLFGPTPPWLVMAAGVPLGGLLGFLVYLVLMRPVKKETRRLYPITERLAQAAERCAAIGRKFATERAEREKAECARRRDQQLGEIERWQAEQIRARLERLNAERETIHQQWRDQTERAGQVFTADFTRIGNEMRLRAEETARAITHELEDTEAALDRSREASEAERRQELQHLENRIEKGVSRAVQRAISTAENLAARHPDWPPVVEGGAERFGTVDFLPVGTMDVNSPGVSEPSTGPRSAPLELPIALHRRVHSGLLITAPSERLSEAVDVAHQVLWRLLVAASPGRAKLLLIDPLGRGQNFTSFMALADYDPTLVGHRVWTTEAQIESRLGEMAHHVEDVLQAMLRDRYARIEDYNAVAGTMAEPYHAIAAVGFPDGFSRGAFRHLQALIESGLRCGVFTVLVADRSQPWPAEMPPTSLDKLLPVRIDPDGSMHCDQAGLEEYSMRPAAGPPGELRPALVQRLGSEAVAAARVEIPLETVLAPPPANDGSTATGLSIPVGSQGAGRSLCIELGEGVRQHVLIVGKTGSGKSTLLHAIIVSGAFHYRPDELELYLLDFKKGVEFKPYAEAGLPHVRVIGIESEREFGHSVLQRLDQELHQRGESFRASGAHDLAAYRAATGTAMPRILVVVDEFQELFVRDDRLAADCAMLLDRLVRQGRSFGIHVILSSQSLAGAHALPRATLGQMAVRIALQCSESDAALILGDDNTAARLIGRPGEAIYNDAGGLLEGNRPFQVAWLAADRHHELLESIATRDAALAAGLSPPVIFEGNRPCRWSPAMAEAAVGRSKGIGCRRGLLGEPVEIGPPATLELTADAGRNLLMIAPPESRGAVLSGLLSSLVRGDPESRVVYFDGHRPGDGGSVAAWLTAAGVAVESVPPRESEPKMVHLDTVVKDRIESAEDGPPLFIVIDPLERFRDLRQDDTFHFSLDSAEAAGGGLALQNVLREGPAVNVFSIVVCGATETLARWLPRNALHDLELRLLGRLNASDSAALIDTPAAAELSTATMLLYDDADGRIIKFRPCDQPDPSQVKAWLASPESSTYC